MKILVYNTVELSMDDMRAFCRYSGSFLRDFCGRPIYDGTELVLTSIPERRAAIVKAVRSRGTIWLEEQIREGRTMIARDLEGCE